MTQIAATATVTSADIRGYVNSSDQFSADCARELNRVSDDHLTRVIDVYSGIEPVSSQTTHTLACMALLGLGATLGANGQWQTVRDQGGVSVGVLRVTRGANVQVTVFDADSNLLDMDSHVNKAVRANLGRPGTTVAAGVVVVPIEEFRTAAIDTLLADTTEAITAWLDAYPAVVREMRVFNEVEC